MGIFQFKLLASQKNVQHGVSTRECGSIKNQDGTINKTNLGNFFRQLNLPIDKSVKMNQIHSGNVAIVNSVDDGLQDNIDGMVTNHKNIPLYVLTADCLPILFFDEGKHAVGVAHCGRRGLQNGIIKNMVNKFKSEFGSDPKDIIVGIGPGIEKKCYEVDGELMDIKAIAKLSLINLGIKEENINDANICTKCNKDLYFSYRGGDKYERFATAISLI